MQQNNLIVTNTNTELSKIDKAISIGNKLLLTITDYQKVFNFYTKNLHFFFNQIMIFYELNEIHHSLILHNFFLKDHKEDCIMDLFKFNSVNITDLRLFVEKKKILANRKNYASTFDYQNELPKFPINEINKIDLNFIVENLHKYELTSIYSSKEVWDKVFKKYVDDSLIDEIIKYQKWEQDEISE